MSRFLSCLCEIGIKFLNKLVTKTLKSSNQSLMKKNKKFQQMFIRNKLMLTRAVNFY